MPLLGKTRRIKCFCLNFSIFFIKTTTKKEVSVSGSSTQNELNRLKVEAMKLNPDQRRPQKRGFDRVLGLAPESKSSDMKDRSSLETGQCMMSCFHSF